MDENSFRFDGIFDFADNRLWSFVFEIADASEKQSRRFQLDVEGTSGGY